MQTNQEDVFFLNEPLIPEETQHKLEDVEPEIEPEAVDNDSSSSNASFFKTCFNGLNALSGVGLLSTPYALASGGWLSLALLFLIAIAAFYSGLLIQRCMVVDSNIRTYPDIGDRAFGKKGRLLVSIFMNIELYLVATGFLILEGDNLENLFPNMKLEVGALIVGAKQSFVLIVALIILPTVWVDNLSMLSYVSACGIAASAITLGSIFWAGAFDGVGFHQKGTLLNLSGIPTAISLYAFCYCAHPVFPTLYTSMRNKHQFSYVLLVCFLVCTFIYASMAIFGYLMFGSNVESQVTLNLPTDKISSRVAIYTTVANPIAKYALMVKPIINATKNLIPSHSNKKPCSLLISTALLVSSIIVALTVPLFGYLMSLVGAFLSVTASIILPCLCYLKISGTYRRFGWEMAVNICIIIMGVLVAVICTYKALVELIEHL